MKELLKKISNKRIFYFILILVIILTPYAISLEPEGNTKSIVLVLGFDKLENQIEVSAQVLIPKYSEGFSENIKVISSKGNDLSDAIDKMSFHLGKIFTLEHCSTIVLGQDFSNEDVIKNLDYLFRGKKITGNAFIVQSNTKAKDLVQLSSTINNSFSLSLDNIMQFNQAKSLKVASDINSFLTSYYSPTGISYCQLIELVSNSDEGLEVKELQSNSSGNSSSMSGSSGTSGSQSSQSGSQQDEEKKVIKNEQMISVFNKGVKVFDLTTEETQAFNYIAGDSNDSILHLENINDENHSNANASYSIRDKVVNKKIKYKNKKPQIIFNIKFIISLEEIENGGQQMQFMNTSESYITNTVKNRLSNSIRADLGAIINKCKTEKIDLFGFYDLLYRNSNSQFLDYLSKLPQDQNYLDDIEIFVNIDISGRS